MFVERVRTYQFRNLNDGIVTFPQAPVYIVGDNGHGKTSLLEAISFVSTTKSFRTNLVSELVRLGSDKRESSVFLNISGPDYTTELGIAYSGQKREATIDGQKTKSLEDFLGKLKTVVFSPRDLALVQGAPSSRRTFIGKHLVDYDKSSLRLMVSYQRILQSKNACLRTGRATDAELDSWNEMLAKASIALTQARRKFVELLQMSTERIYRQFAQADGNLQMRLAANLDTEDLAEVLARFNQARERERAVMSATHGAHRDELEITLAGKATRSFASQGQARSIAVALTMAVVELIEEASGEPIVLLLDDLDSELDGARRAFLIEAILGNQRQTFITGTEARLPKNLVDKTAVYSVQNGIVAALPNAHNQSIILGNS